MKRSNILSMHWFLRFANCFLFLFWFHTASQGLVDIQTDFLDEEKKKKTKQKKARTRIVIQSDMKYKSIFSPQINTYVSIYPYFSAASVC